MGRRRKTDSPFRAILCQLMDNTELSVRGAAQIAEVPPSTLANWRAGATPDNHLAIKRLSDYFGISLAFLLTGENENSEKKSDDPLIKKVRERIGSDTLVLENAKVIIQFSHSEKIRS